MTAIHAPRLLVVEDEPEILAEVSGYLRRRGELVKTAATYNEAMRALKDEGEPVDVLVSDVRLPDGSGIDLIRWAKNRSGRCFPCILMTGHLEQADLAPEFESSGVRIVYKPFSLAMFYREVRASLDASASASTGAMVHAGATA